jgi:serine/threonine protein kinase
MDDPADVRVGSTVGGKYHITSVLAAGGMGVVYRAEDTERGAEVAVKFLHQALVAFPDLVKRFRREAAALDLVKHPNLVSVIDSGLAEGAPYLVMDLHQGRSLGDLLDEVTALPAPRAVAITRQILSGVAHAHAMQVVHRDLKPDNIMLLEEDGVDSVKVLDFGLAKVLHEDPDAATRLTNTGFALGTPGYMSPEQAQGLAADGRSDLYAVGVMLYHMVTGRKPFIGDLPLAVVRMHIDDPPPPPRRIAPTRDCSVELEKAILRAMEKKPADRYSTAEEFSAALAATPEGRGKLVPITPVPATDPPTVHGKPKKRRRVASPALLIRLLVFFTVAGIAGFGWTQLSAHQQKRARLALEEIVRAVKSTFHSIDGVENKDKAADKAQTKAPPPKSPANAPRANDSPPAPPVNAAPVANAAPPAPPANAAPPAPPANAALPPNNPPTPTANAVAAAPAPTPSTPMPPPGESANTPPANAADDDDDDDAPPPAAPTDTPGAQLEASSPPEAPKPKAAPKLADATKLLSAGKTDEAIQLLYALRKRTPRSAEIALQLGHAYFRKLWRADGLREYETAIAIRPTAKREPLIHRNAVAALDSHNYKLARGFIKFRLGALALPELRRAARSKNSTLAIRASRLANQLSKSRTARAR